MYRPGLFTSHRHVNQRSINNSWVVFFSFIFKNNFSVQKCQLFKVGFHIATCVQVYHGPQSYKCSLAGFLFEKSVRLFPNPAKGEGRKSNAPGRTLETRFWSREEKEYRAWPVRLNNYFVGTHGTVTGALKRANFTRPWPLSVYEKMVRLCNDS